MDKSKIKENVIEYSNFSLKLEKERESDLFRTANALTTCISILLVATMTMIFELLDRLKSIDYLIIPFGIVLVFFLLLSLFFSLKSYWFYKKPYTRSGNELINYINDNLEYYMKEDGFLDQKINDVDYILKCLDKNNTKRRNNLMISTTLIYLFLVLVLIFGFITLCVA